MSKYIRVKVLCEIQFELEDYADTHDIRAACGLTDYEAVTDKDIIEYIEGECVYELNDQFGIADAEIKEVIVS